MAISNYEIKGGTLSIVEYSGKATVSFSFYIYDRKAKIAAYCMYGSDVSGDTVTSATVRGEVKEHTAGAGSRPEIIDRAKPIDLKKLHYATCSLYLVKTKESALGGLAILNLDKGDVRILFPIIGNFDRTLPATTH